MQIITWAYCTLAQPVRWWIAVHLEVRSYSWNFTGDWVICHLVAQFDCYWMKSLLFIAVSSLNFWTPNYWNYYNESFHNFQKLHNGQKRKWWCGWKNSLKKVSMIIAYLINKFNCTTITKSSIICRCIRSSTRTVRDTRARDLLRAISTFPGISTA